MSDTPRTDAHDEAYTQVSYQELAGRFEAENARLAAQLATSTEKIDYSDKGVFDALLRDNARLAADLDDARDLYTQVQQQVCDLDRAESDKIQEVRQAVCDLRDELAEARDAIKAVWRFRLGVSVI